MFETQLWLQIVCLCCQSANVVPVMRKWNSSGHKKRGSLNWFYHKVFQRDQYLPQRVTFSSESNQTIFLPHFRPQMYRVIQFYHEFVWKHSTTEGIFWIFEKFPWMEDVSSKCFFTFCWHISCFPLSRKQSMLCCAGAVKSTYREDDVNDLTWCALVDTFISLQLWSSRSYYSNWQKETDNSDRWQRYSG